MNFDDFAPTFLELAGLPPFAEATGKSLMPLLSGSPADATRDAVFFVPRASCQREAR